MRPTKNPEYVTIGERPNRLLRPLTLLGVLSSAQVTTGDEINHEDKTTARGRFVNLDADKLRGGYYTSPELARWLCQWAIRSSDECVLEPSCGNGEILLAAARRLHHLGAACGDISQQVKGVEINTVEADKALARLQELNYNNNNETVEVSDFFGWWQAKAHPSFDAVVGNPPFIRYQAFPEPHRGRAMSIMSEFGLTPNRLTNIWVPFVVAAAASLRPGGRLALVLPAELLQVSYASQLRTFLIETFKSLDIVTCNQLFFEKAEQEVVLLLADGASRNLSGSDFCEVRAVETRTVASITDTKPFDLLRKAKPKSVRHDDEKWLKYFLSEREICFMREIRESSITTDMSTHASINVGVVTGKNDFFVLTSDQVSQLGLSDFVTPLISRSVHLKGSRVGRSDWRNLATDNDRVFLLDLAPFIGQKPVGALARYIRSGMESEIHKGYKCSIREPWYAVPAVWVPDGFTFRQIYDFPRMVLNQAGATSTDTIHRLTCKKSKPERVIANTYSWLTAASAEIEGRSYGGGVLELEPTEAERLLMPAQLNGAMPLKECDLLVRAGKLDEVLEQNAKLVLLGHMGLSKGEALTLRDIWVKMRDRRLSRRRQKSVKIGQSS